MAGHRLRWWQANVVDTVLLWSWWHWCRKYWNGAIITWISQDDYVRILASNTHQTPSVFPFTAVDSSILVRGGRFHCLDFLCSSVHSPRHPLTLIDSYSIFYFYFIFITIVRKNRQNSLDNLEIFLTVVVGGDKWYVYIKKVECVDRIIYQHITQHNNRLNSHYSGNPDTPDYSCAIKWY